MLDHGPSFSLVNMEPSICIANGLYLMYNDVTYASDYAIAVKAVGCLLNFQM